MVLTKTRLLKHDFPVHDSLGGGGVFHFSLSNLSPVMGNRFLSSAGVGKSCVLPIRVPNPSPTLDKNLASMGPGILSSIGVGVWRKGSEAFPDSNTTLDTFQSVT